MERFVVKEKGVAIAYAKVLIVYVTHKFDLGVPSTILARHRVLQVE